MPRTLTGQDLIDRVRALGDFESDPHKDDAKIMMFLSDGYAEMYDILVSSGLMYFRTKKIYTSDGGQSYSLPDDFFGTVRVDYQYTADVVWPLREISPRELHKVTRTGQRAFMYEAVNNNLILYPTPPAGQQYNLYYIPAPVVINSTTQVIDGFSGWEIYAVTYAVMQLKTRSDEDMEVHQKRLDKIAKRIADAAQNRTMGSATSLVQDDGLFDWEFERDPANWRQF